MMHRIREGRVCRRAASVGQTSGAGPQFGVPIINVIGHFGWKLSAVLERAANELTDRGRKLIFGFRNELEALQEQMDAAERRIE